MAIMWGVVVLIINYGGHGRWKTRNIIRLVRQEIKSDEAVQRNGIVQSVSRPHRNLPHRLAQSGSGNDQRQIVSDNAWFTPAGAVMSSAIALKSTGVPAERGAYGLGTSHVSGWSVSQYPTCYLFSQCFKCKRFNEIALCTLADRLEGLIVPTANHNYWKFDSFGLEMPQDFKAGHVR